MLQHSQHTRIVLVCGMPQCRQWPSNRLVWTALTWADTHPPGLQIRIYDVGMKRADVDAFPCCVHLARCAAGCQAGQGAVALVLSASQLVALVLRPGALL